MNKLANEGVKRGKNQLAIDEMKEGKLSRGTSSSDLCIRRSNGLSPGIFGIGRIRLYWPLAPAPLTKEVSAGIAQTY